jgi:hypothetical protein
MSPRVLPPGQPSPRLWTHLARSTYVTALTDWFLTFVGKAAHLVLILTTLYTSAELLPGVTFPTLVSNAVFLVQMLALDVGGLGLAKLAMQARDQGNDAGARQAETLSRWLIRIVIASLVTVALEQTIRAFPGSAALSAVMAGATTAIGGILTIARAICAVYYGRVMHLLGTTEAPPALSVPDVEQVVRQAVSDLTTTALAEQGQALTQMQQAIEARLASLTGEQLAQAFLPLLETLVQQQGHTLLDEGERRLIYLLEQQRIQEPMEEASGAHLAVSNREHSPQPAPEASREQHVESAVLVSRSVQEEEASRSADARLYVAARQLQQHGQRLSGRALAKAAHVKRETATHWLAALTTQRFEQNAEATTHKADVPEPLIPSQGEEPDPSREEGETNVDDP